MVVEQHHHTAVYFGLGRSSQRILEIAGGCGKSRENGADLILDCPLECMRRNFSRVCM
jgi:hypothetical protein